MFRFGISRPTHIPIIICVAIGLHLWWALMLFISDEAAAATALNAIARHIHSPLLTTIVIAGAALLAFVALYIRTSWVAVFFLPQQILLMMSASGCIEAMWLSQYSDGVIRPWEMISTDQFYSVLTALGHTWAIILVTLERGLKA